MPGRAAPSRAASQQARINQAKQLLRGQQEALQGQIERDDSDDELGDDDVPWAWIYPSTGPLSPVSANKAPKENPNMKKRRRDGTPVETADNTDAKPIGAKLGSRFECYLGDCLLLKAEGHKVAWVGMVVDFGIIEDELSAQLMWFSTHSEIRNKEKKRKDHVPVRLPRRNLNGGW